MLGVDLYSLSPLLAYLKIECKFIIKPCTVNAGELGPLGKLSPDNIQLNEIGFFLLLQ